MHRIETTIFDSPLLRIGTWRCPTWYPRFTNTGPTKGYLLVFPRTSVYIQHAGRRRFVTDPNIVVFYNKDQEYRRKKLSEQGDRCEWFSFSSQTLVDAVRPYDPAVVDRRDEPFLFTHGPSTARTYLLQRMVVEHVQTSTPPDCLFVEETMLAVLDSVVRAAYEVHAEPPEAARAETVKAHADIVHAVKRVLAARFTETLTLDEIAQAVHTSPYHLCRIFHQQTGVTIHRYLHQIRLRTSLEFVAQGERSLTEVGLDLGYSTPSHFSKAFKDTFGMPPSRLRRTASTRQLKELSKIVKV